MKTLVKSLAFGAAALLTPLPAIAGNAFIPLGSDNIVVVIDTSTDTITGKIEGLPAVHGLAATPDGRYLVAGSYDERPAGTGLPERPSGVTEDEHNAHHAKPDPEKAADAESVSSLSVVDLSEGQVIRRIDVPGAVHHVAVSPDGALAAVTHPQNGTVTIVDLKNARVASTIQTGPLPNYVAFHPDGSRLYASNAGNNTISEINVGARIINRNLIVGESPEHLVLSGDGDRLYVNNIDDGSVSVVNLRSWTIDRTLEIGTVLHGIDLNDDETGLFVAALGNDQLQFFNFQSGTRKSIDLAPSPYHLASVPGTGKVYISSADEPKIWVVDQRELKVLSEIAIGGKGHQMVFVGSGS